MANAAIVAFIPGNKAVSAHSRPLQDPGQIRDFALAGNATLTLVSKVTGARFTYRIAAPTTKSEKHDPDQPIRFVSVLNGTDNESSFRYIGIIDRRRNHNQFRATGKTKVAKGAPSFRAFEYFAARVIERGHLPENLEVWHEGKCCRCGRKLTVPSSIESGWGPECIKRVTH